MYQVLVIQGVGRIKQLSYFDTKDKAYQFANEESGYNELDPERDDPHHYDKYDPPVVLIMEGSTKDDLDNGKYLRPIAVFHKGIHWLCVNPLMSDAELPAAIHPE